MSAEFDELRATLTRRQRELLVQAIRNYEHDGIWCGNAEDGSWLEEDVGETLNSLANEFNDNYPYPDEQA